MKIEDLEADVYFGEVEDDETDWREDPPKDIDPDDEELDQTPADVIAVLGFDPKDL